jgi:hypothetical protein
MKRDTVDRTVVDVDSAQLLEFDVSQSKQNLNHNRTRNVSKVKEHKKRNYYPYQRISNAGLCTTATTATCNKAFVVARQRQYRKTDIDRRPFEIDVNNSLSFRRRRRCGCCRRYWCGVFFTRR